MINYTLNKCPHCDSKIVDIRSDGVRVKFGCNAVYDFIENTWHQKTRCKKDANACFCEGI
jgi:hypothetical protein